MCVRGCDLLLLLGSAMLPWLLTALFRIPGMSSTEIFPLDIYRPQTKFAKVMFLQVSVCPHRGGVCGFIRGACVVLFGGACVVLFGGHAWFYSGGRVWFYSGGAWFYSGGHAWFIRGGMHGFIWGACVVLFGGVRGFFSFFGYNQIRSMSGRYASYWNAFLLTFILQHKRCILTRRAGSVLY